MSIYGAAGLALDYAPGCNIKSIVKCDVSTSGSPDMLSNPLLMCALFCAPAVAIVFTAGHGVGNAWRTAVWTIALVVLGSACLANAVRCGRVHCYVTGPFFLLMALASLLYGVGILPLGGSGWNLIGAVILAGAIALTCLPEMLVGKYRRNTTRVDHS